MNCSGLLKTTLVFTLLINFFWACTPEAEDLTKDLIGRWDISEATRNGKPAPSLADLYFEFFNDGSMRTNISGVEEEAVYQLENRKLLQRESQLQLDYDIEEINDSTLVLSTVTRGFTIRILLEKTIQER